MDKVFIVVDAQNDFITDALRNEDAIAALPTVKKVVDYAVDNKQDLIFTMDTHFENYLNTLEGKNLPVPHCICNSQGWRICEKVLPDNDYPFRTIVKESFGYGDWYEEVFDGLEEIVICGFDTDICVVSNALILKACYPEVPITVISDACAGTTPANHAAALAVLQSCQVKVMSWEDYLG